MTDDDFSRKRAKFVRELATRADPFTRRRLLDLASRYESIVVVATKPPSAPTDGLRQTDHASGSDDSA
jgi:hypothetical protein